jgi:hypothetical protein
MVPGRAPVRFKAGTQLTLEPLCEYARVMAGQCGSASMSSISRRIGSMGAIVAAAYGSSAGKRSATRQLRMESQLSEGWCVSASNVSAWRGLMRFSTSKAPPLAAATPTQPEKQTAQRSLRGSGRSNGAAAGCLGMPQCVKMADERIVARRCDVPPAELRRAESSAVLVSSQIAPPTRAATRVARSAHCGIAIPRRAEPSSSESTAVLCTVSGVVRILSCGPRKPRNIFARRARSLESDVPFIPRATAAAVRSDT